MPLTPKPGLDRFARGRKRMAEFLIRDARRRWLAARSWRDARFWAVETDRCLDRYIAEFYTSREDAPV